MAEPTVQVPMSLLRKVRNFAAAGRYYGEVEQIDALLSQPTPTAEPKTRQQRAQEVIDRNERDRLRSAPPIIAQMVPYTEFTADTLTKPVRWRIEPDGWYSRVVDDGRSYFPDPEFDPSTIRDVTPPADAS